MVIVMMVVPVMNVEKILTANGAMSVRAEYVKNLVVPIMIVNLNTNV